MRIITSAWGMVWQQSDRGEVAGSVCIAEHHPTQSQLKDAIAFRVNGQSSGFQVRTLMVAGGTDYLQDTRTPDGHARVFFKGIFAKDNRAKWKELQTDADFATIAVSLIKQYGITEEQAAHAVASFSRADDSKARWAMLYNGTEKFIPIHGTALALAIPKDSPLSQVRLLADNWELNRWIIGDDTSIPAVYLAEIFKAMETKPEVTSIHSHY